MSRVVVYVRVSTDAQAIEGRTSLASQEAACRAFADDLGLDVIDVLRETYTGVEYFDRPAMSRLRQMLRERTVDAVMFYVVDRVSRGGIYAALLHEEARDAGVQLYEANARWTVPMTDAGELLMYIGGWQGKGEWRQLRERTVRGKKGRIESGKIHRHGSELYGYRRDKDAGVRCVFESEAAIVRDIFRWYVDDRLSIRAIVKRLNDAGIPSPATGKLLLADGRTPVWGRSQVARMLGNPAYVGETIAWRWQSNGTHRNATLRDTSEWVTLPDGVTPAIIDRATWDAAAQRRQTNTGETTRNQSRPILLRGLVQCAVCGRRMTPDIEHGRYRVYRCTSRGLHGGACGSSRVLASSLETWTQASIRAWIEARARGETSRLRRDNDDGALLLELEAARTRLARIAAGQERIITSAAQSDAVPWDLVEREVSRGEREKAPIVSLIARLERQIIDRQTSTDRERTVDEWCATAAGDINGWGFAEWRHALEWLGIRVIANGADWHLTVAD